MPLVIQPLRSARRLRLRFDSGRQLLKLTYPARMSRSRALAWVGEQREWIEAQVAEVEPPKPLAPGATIPLEGRDVTIAWDLRHPRTPVVAGGHLHCGGPLEGLDRRITRFLKRRALDILSLETAAMAERIVAKPVAVSVGDADTRWGSCSSSGRIRYSWRLILTPPEARRFVVAHEVAHLKHLNHGPAFKALEAELFGPGVAEAKALLRRVGPRIRRVGRGG